MICLWLPRSTVEHLIETCGDDQIRETLLQAVRSADLFGETTAKVLLVADRGDEAHVCGVQFSEQADADRAWERLQGHAGDDLFRAVVDLPPTSVPVNPSRSARWD